jgi:hypothetical protein
MGAFACVVVAGALLGYTGTTSPPGLTSAVGPSGVPAEALSSSWFCAGATESPKSVAGGQLLFYNGGGTAVPGSVDLVSQGGYQTKTSVTVPAGAAITLDERLPGLTGSNSDHWVGAIVTLYGGMASVSQVVTTPYGSASQPCASAASSQWYFAYGATLRNAWDEISLLNPYPVPAVADLSFTTDEGREQPVAFEGVIVPADGLSVVSLRNHLRRRQHIAVTVTARAGQLVAFETEIVTQPPAGAPPVGVPGAVNPVLPVPGITLTLGSTQPATSLWWPDAGEGPGLTESYAVYNPGPTTARLTLSLVPGAGGGGLASSSQFTVGPFGSALVTTNGQPWALPSTSYAAHLESANGTGVVAERFVMTAPPSPERGLAALMGQDQASRDWLVTGGITGESSFVPSPEFLGDVWLEVVDPGRRPAVMVVESLEQGKWLRLGTDNYQVGPGQRDAIQLSAAVAGEALVVSSSRPILLEQDWFSSLPSIGINLSPAAPVG